MENNIGRFRTKSLVPNCGRRCARATDRMERIVFSFSVFAKPHLQFINASSAQTFGQNADQNFGHVFDQVFGSENTVCSSTGTEIQCTALLGQKMQCAVLLGQKIDEKNVRKTYNESV